MSAISFGTREWLAAVPLNDREALARLVAYARDEASRSGETMCAELLAAALMCLENAPARPPLFCVGDAKVPQNLI